MLKEIKATLAQWLGSTFNVQVYDYEIPLTSEYRFPCATISIGAFKEVAENTLQVEFTVDFAFKAHYRAGGEIEDKILDLLEKILAHEQVVVEGNTVRFDLRELGIQRLLDDNYYTVILTIPLIVVKGGR